VLNLAMSLGPASYLTFHLVLLVTGLLLLGSARIRRPPSAVAQLAGGAVALAGLVGSALPALAVECCSGRFAVRHGFPFTMLARDPGGWRFDLGRTVADLIFWACAGLIVTMVLAHVLPALERPARKRPVESPWGRTGHAESRNAGHPARPDGARAADDENVGGLP
jgi:hypothetical protein